MINPTLLKLAQHRVWKDTLTKQAATPPMGGDPSMGGGGAPPMDPSMMGGAGGGAPPMDPSMMGGGAPPAAPAPMPGQMPGQQQPMMGDPAQAMAMGQAPPKLKPEQMMQMLDFRLYNMQQQITALMNAQGVTLPPGALVTPPGSPTPVAEAAVPGGPNDPGVAAGGGGGGGGGGGDPTGGGASAIGAIDPIQGASPDLAGGGGGGGGAKTASYEDLSFRDLMLKLANDDADEDEATSQDNEDDENADEGATSSNYDEERMGDWMNDQTKVASMGQPFPQQLFTGSPSNNVAALAALLRQRTQQVG